ncbi:hypothetical protein [Streptomyces sp. NPDC059949]|uniref:hypothetical protein n=1 Tax=Streptomyces sp. NPDC059949 TaxID=3347013 RepID=UPI003656C805
MQLGEGGACNATAAQRENFRQEAGRSMREAGLGFGDEAYRGDPGFAGVCALVVRDGNLAVRVSLGGSTYPAATCDQDARKIAKAAVEAVPR